MALADVRLHCLGIGSASQDRFLALLARETGGVSRFMTPRERVDLSAGVLFVGASALARVSRLIVGHFSTIRLWKGAPSYLRDG